MEKTLSLQLDILYFYNKSPAISWRWRTELRTNFRFRSEPKGPITWSIFNPGVELSPVYRVEISALSVIQNSIKIKRAIDYMTKFSTQNKGFFYFRESMPRTYSITFQPGDEIVHVIAKKFNPVNRAEFNPGVENAPCNRPLIQGVIGP
jgi:hypothetical protein